MRVNPLAYKYADLNRNLRASLDYESELSALKTAFFQRQQRFPDAAEQANLQAAAYEAVYGPPVTCGHQLTEAETDYYQKYPYRDRLCKRCTMEERAR